jgi:anti-sigma factor RsiW
MNCRTFRRRHVLYVDDLVSGVELAELRRHVSECPDCARRDANVRRALMLVRSIRPIELSADFRERLLARIRLAATVPELAPRVSTGRRLAVAAAIFLALGYASWDYAARRDRAPLELAPVIASIPEPPPEPAHSPVLASPAIVASFSTGLTLWPAALVAEQGSDYFVHTALASANLSR